MEFDPLSRDSAPPRYELESGSEDDDVDVKELGPRPAVEIRGAGSLSTGSEVVVLIQHAGLACLDKSSIPTEHSAIYVGETQQASIAETSQSQTIVYVSSTSQHVPQSRYYELAQAVLDHLAPSSLVVVDSYSPASNVFRSDSDGLSGRLRYLADSTWPQSRIDPSLMVPLSSPESVSGLGAAFITGAVMKDTPALLALVQDAQHHAHIQLYGSASEGNVRLSEESAQAIRKLVFPSASSAPPSSTQPNIVAFAKRRFSPFANSTLGDGNMYI